MNGIVHLALCIHGCGSCKYGEPTVLSLPAELNNSLGSTDWQTLIYTYDSFIIQMGFEYNYLFLAYEKL